MNTKERTREDISAFADGELSDNQLEMMLAALRTAEGRAEWDLYHQIGDVLRSDEMAVPLSVGFAAKMAARLEAEPTIVAPAAVNTSQNVSQQASGRASAGTLSRFRRFAMPGMAAAAVITAVFVTTPHLMVTEQENLAVTEAPIIKVSNPAPVGPVAEVPAVASAESNIVTLDQQDGVVLRDARIDDYLMAHQRFSPSVLSTAQYARSATFAIDSGK